MLLLALLFPLLSLDVEFTSQHPGLFLGAAIAPSVSGLGEPWDPAGLAGESPTGYSTELSSVERLC